ncbi:hypothetical protein DYB31_007003, partial [Aphanomyces astaci]
GLAGVPSRPNPVDVDSSPGVGLKDDNITPNIEEVEFEVSFVEGKIGLSLEVIHPNVVRVKDTSGAARACNIIEIGDVLVRVQGVDIAAHRFAHVMHTLKSAPRPLTVRFRRPVRTVELPPHFQLDRDLDQPFEYRHRGGPQDADSVRACHEESDNDSTYVVRVKAARDGPDGRTWGDFSAWSAPLATMASEDDLQDAKDALARKEAALAVVAHLKDMANSVKGLYQASVK